jgi:DNA-binding transcriptional LysR family regulator
MTNAFEETKIPPGTGHPIGDADISLRHLFVFATVAREGSAASAAGKLLRGSSAIVRSVGALERQLGERLFDRHPRGMVINAFGQAVLTRADRIAAELTELSQAVDERRSAPPGGRARAIFSALPNSRSLAFVVALAERSNMAAVAREFGLTHAAISTALKTLEDRSEIELFDRSPRGLVTDTRPRVLLHSRDERFRRFDCGIQESFVHQNDKQGERSRLAVDRFARVELQSVKSAKKGGLRLIRRATMSARRSKARSATSSSIRRAC